MVVDLNKKGKRVKNNMPMGKGTYGSKKGRPVKGKKKKMTGRKKMGSKVVTRKKTAY